MPKIYKYYFYPSSSEFYFSRKLTSPVELAKYAEKAAIDLSSYEEYTNTLPEEETWDNFQIKDFYKWLETKSMKWFLDVEGIVVEKIKIN